MSRLGELLVRENLISLDQLQKAQDEQRKTGARLGFSLMKLGILGEQELTGFLSKQYGVPSISLLERKVSEDVLQLVPGELSKRHQLLPVQRAGATLVVAMSDPSNIYAIDDLKFRTGLNIEVVVASEVAIDEAIHRYYEKKTPPEAVLDERDTESVEISERETTASATDLEKSAENESAVKLCSAILVNAIKKRASDIHIEPYEKMFRVRYRIGGVLHEEQTLPLELKNAVTSRMKILANLDIAERRLPQDGTIKIKAGDKSMDFRVSVLPTLFGEKIALRLLDKSSSPFELNKLGLDEKQLADFTKAIHQPSGLVLVTGESCSGKTTTLYAALQELNKTTRNISTVEDLVERNLSGINQVQMNDAVGLSFAAALRTFLRQDVNVIMVGEIRDVDTAELSVKAARTGHMVLAAMHTHDAAEAIAQLLTMGVEPFLVSSVSLVVAQHLVRRVCKDCALPVSESVKALMDLGVKQELAQTAKLVRGQGCRACANTGYKGRVALFEVMPLGKSLAELVGRRASPAELKAEALRLGMKSLRAAGIEKLLEGITTVEEVLRVSVAD